MERNALLAVAISIAILLVYYEILLPRLYPPPARPLPGQAQTRTEPEPLNPTADTIAPAPEAEAAAPEAKALADAPKLTVETDLYKAEFTAAGGRLRSFVLKHFLTTA